MSEFYFRNTYNSKLAPQDEVIDPSCNAKDSTWVRTVKPTPLAGLISKMRNASRVSINMFFTTETN